MKELLESIAKALVDHPESVQVKAVEGEQITIFEYALTRTISEK
jgi:predicted RNA-binding protein YlqC (UPF0109 family)